MEKKDLKNSIIDKKNFESQGKEINISLNEIKTIYKAINIIDNFDYSYDYSDDYMERNKAIEVGDNLIAIVNSISNPKYAAILQQTFNDSNWNLKKVNDSDYNNLKKEIIELLDEPFRDDLRTIMRDIIGESSDIGYLDDDVNNPRPLINVKSYGRRDFDIVCSFRYDEERKDYIISAHPPKFPYGGRIDEDIIHEIAVKDMSFKDVENLLCSRAIKKAKRFFYSRADEKAFKARFLQSIVREYLSSPGDEKAVREFCAALRDRIGYSDEKVQEIFAETEVNRQESLKVSGRKAGMKIE